VLEFSPELLRTRLRRRWQQLESWYGLGRFQNLLPLEVRRASVLEAFGVTGFCQTFNGRRLDAGK
jgi:hypothetical protein